MYLRLKSNTVGAAPNGIQVDPTSTALLGFDTDAHYGTIATGGSVDSDEETFNLLDDFMRWAADITPGSEVWRIFVVNVLDVISSSYEFQGTRGRLAAAGTRVTTTVAGVFVVRVDEDAESDQTIYMRAGIGLATVFEMISAQAKLFFAVNDGDDNIELRSLSYGTGSNVRIVEGDAGLLAELGLAVGLGDYGTAQIDGDLDGPIEVLIANLERATALELVDAFQELAPDIIESIEDGSGIVGGFLSAEGLAVLETGLGIVITALFPEEAEDITRATLVELTVGNVVEADPLPPLIVVADYDGHPSEMIYDGEVFRGYFDNPRCTRTDDDDSNTASFTILRAGGWHANPTIRVFPTGLAAE